MYSFGTDEYIGHAVKTCSQSMLRAAYTVLHCTADAEDAAQEAFVRLMTRQPSLRDDEHMKAWLLRVTINIARNMRRSQARAGQPIDEQIPCPPGEDGELLELVLSLPEKYSTAIHLYYYEGYSINEIADILMIPPATAGTRLARGRKMLKEMLEGESKP